jgi:hypothetical protein
MVFNSSTICSNLLHWQGGGALIWSEYKSLDVMSRNARYYAVEITPAHIQDVRNAFDTLRAYIRRELGLS